MDHSASSPTSPTFDSLNPRARFVSTLLGAIFLFIALAMPAALPAQTPLLGGMRATGNFFLITNFYGNLQIREWNNAGTGSWSTLAQMPGMTPLSIGGLTASGGIHFTVANSAGPVLWRWEPNTAPVNESRPASAPSSFSAPSAVMYGNRVMLVGGGQLHERFMFGNTTWFTHGYPSGNVFNTLREVPPCVLSDGHVFVASNKGEVHQLWWNGTNNTWNWLNHGYPKKFNWFGTGGVKATMVGAAMPLANKVFVTCADGSLRQIYYDGSHWIWYNHGNPFGYSADTPAVAVSNSKLFVTGIWNNNRVLLQLYHNGSTWVWYNHGSPPGTNIASGATAAIGGDNVAVAGSDGNFHMLSWIGSTWAWRNLGH